MKEDAYLSEDDKTDENVTERPLSALKGRRTWEFSVPVSSGEEVRCKGSEPDTSQEVSKVIHPVDDAELLYKRTIDYLHISPHISDDDWEEIAPTNKALIAAKHLHNWNVYDLISQKQIEEAKRRLIESS